MPRLVLDKVSLAKVNAPMSRKSQTTPTGLPLVRLNLIKPFLLEMQRRRIEPAGPLRKFDMSPELIGNADVFVPASVVYGVLEAFATAADDPHLGVHLGAALNIAEWSPFIEASATANNTAELLLSCAINASKDASSASLNLETSGERTRFHVQRLADSNVTPAQADAFWIGILVSILEQATGAEWEPNDVLATVCDPRALPTNYRHVRIAQGGLDGPSVAFPSGWLFLPFHRRAHQACDTNTPAGVPGRSFLETVRQSLQPHIGEHGLDATLAADLCGMTKRKLQNRLQQQGHTISGLIAELRRDSAAQKLTTTDLSIREIAECVGYPDPTVFSRAFKRWAGLSPQQYRNKHAD